LGGTGPRLCRARRGVPRAAGLRECVARGPRRTGGRHPRARPAPADQRQRRDRGTQRTRLPAPAGVAARTGLRERAPEGRSRGKGGAPVLLQSVLSRRPGAPPSPLRFAVTRSLRLLVAGAALLACSTRCRVG